MERREEPSVHTNSNVSKPRKSVLVIDDSADLLSLIKTILEIDDYQIFTAQSGKEAFELLSEIDRPNLIFLDLNMEGMSGPEFLSTLEEKMPTFVKDVPVVFLTAMDRVPKSKAVGFIRKPFDDIDAFLRATRQFIELGTGSSIYEH
jgi:CheY-like chemotaxis protein